MCASSFCGSGTVMLAAGFSGPSARTMPCAMIVMAGSGPDQRVLDLQVQLAADDDDLAGLVAAGEGLGDLVVGAGRCGAAAPSPDGGGRSRGWYSSRRTGRSR